MNNKIAYVLLALGAGALAYYGLSSNVRAEDTVEKCTKLHSDLKTKVKDTKLSGTNLEKAEAFLKKMEASCANKLFTEAGAAGLDIMIEIDAAKK